MTSRIEDCRRPFHKHLMIRAYAEYAPTSGDEIKLWLEELISFLGMKKLQGPYVSYVEAEGNRGSTAVAMIETSHIAFHIWDEQKPSLLQFDVYTCGSLDVQSTINKVKNYFMITEGEYVLYDREHGLDFLTGGKFGA